MSQPKVGIRELRQHLSRYLRRVADGETLCVTDRGHPVAILGPLPEEATTAQRLVASGRARSPRLELEQLGPPPSVDTRIAISQALAEQRAES